ncbi:glycosyltransferase family 4 protein [Sagittula sp. NFXS13]|uniref:glycosyltransferase family 4 protein n=1 Tax=Sagittula sp. NFXS13 TaxID=2819095 RepID=UPI0032DE6AE8
MTKKIIAIGSNTSHYVWQARRNLIKCIQDAGYDVVVLAPRDEYSSRLEGLGIGHFALPMRMNKNPVSDYLLYRRFVEAFRTIRPHAYLGYTIKPNIYGSMAAQRLGIPVINNIAGLGTVFTSDGVVTRIVKRLYRAALKSSALVFFQNPDDRALFTRRGIVAHDRHDLLPGSGVDLEKFEFRPLSVPSGHDGLRFLLVARMLWDKGVGEFVEAARALRMQHGENIRFCLLGGMDMDNPDAISQKQMNAWVDAGHVEYLGYSDDVLGEIEKSDCIVLPSAYPEGTPRTLLEASAVGRPIITTDAPGCRTVVDEGLNGYLCKLRDAEDLSEKIAQIIALSPEKRREMGCAGRQKIEREFDEAIVIGKYLDAIRALDRSPKR